MSTEIYDLTGAPIVRCDECGAGMIWVKTEAGKNMPVDYLPVESGNLVATGPRSIRMISAGRPAPVGAIRYRSHWETCTNPKRFRRR